MNLTKISRILIDTSLTASALFIYGVAVMHSKACSFRLSVDYKCKITAVLAAPAEATLEGLRSLRYWSNGMLQSGHGVLDNNESVKRFKKSKSGFNFYKKSLSEQRLGYLLLSYRDVESDIPAVELWDLNHKVLLHKWPMQTLCKKLSAPWKYCGYTLSPLVLPDGSLIFNTQGWGEKLVRINKAGNIIALNDKRLFHHKVTSDSSGNVYATFTKKNNRNDNLRGWGQGVAILDQHLNIKRELMIQKIYDELDLTPRLYSANSTDPIHINDIEIFRYKGDRILLINLRSLSSVIAYNLSRDYPIWILDGFTSQGHDVDVISLSPFKISIFDNNIHGPQENKYLNKLTSLGNKVIFVEGLPLQLARGETRLYTPLDVRKGTLTLRIIDFKRMPSPPKTVTSGMSDYNSSTDSLIVEESNHGRVFAYNIADNKIEWEFINKRKDGAIFGQMSWSTHYNVNPLKQLFTN